MSREKTFRFVRCTLSHSLGMIAGRYRFGYICFHSLLSCMLIVFLGVVLYLYVGVLDELSYVVHLFAIIRESCPFL